MVDFDFLVYLSRLVYPSYNSHCFIFYMLITYNRIKNEKRPRKIHAVSRKTINNLIPKNAHICDINNSVILHGSTVNKNNRSIAIIHIESNGRVVKRRAHLISADLGGDSRVLVSFNLCHNLEKSAACTLRSSRDNSCKFAEEVEVSAISSSAELGHYIAHSLLTNYFKRPKLVYAGDIIEIDLETYGKELFFATNKIVDLAGSAYFRCNKVRGGCFCAAGETKLAQTADLQSFIPASYPISEDFGVIFPCPYGLDSCFSEIKRAVSPFVNGKNGGFRPVFLLEGRKGSGKRVLLQCLARYFGTHLCTVSNVDLAANVYAQNEVKLKNMLFGAKMAAPAILEIRNFENFGKNNEGQYDERLISHFIDELPNFFAHSAHPLLLFCSTNEKRLPVELKRVFLKTFSIPAPNEVERGQHLRWALKKSVIEANCTSIANKTHGFLFEDLRALVHRALTAFAKETGAVFGERHLLAALDFMQANYNESLGAPKVPKVRWEDVGGLGDVKDEIIRTIQLPLKHPAFLKNSGLKRSGILLFGPPGTGKTLIAKAVATECGLCFLSVKGPELLNKYVGQSEQNVREVFERARDASPCIIFFDELDSLAPNRGASGDSGGVMDRVVSQLLAEMDGFDSTATVFIIGATNRPDLIDPALLRPGRFDKLLYIGPCTDPASKMCVLDALTKRFVFECEKDAFLAAVVDLMPGNFSGADFYGVCSNAWMSAVRRLLLRNGSGGDVDASHVLVTLDDFKGAVSRVRPSIRQEDLAYFDQLKAELC